MKTTLTNLIVTLMLSAINIPPMTYGQNTISPVDETATKNIGIPSEGGQISANITSLSWARSGKPPRKIDFVVVPERNLAWVGNPCDRYLYVANAIVGISVRPDKLIINQQTNSFKGTDQQKLALKDQLIAGFEQLVGSGQSDQSKTCYLGEKLLGHRSASPFLPAPERVRPAAPATVSNIIVGNSGITITLVGEKATVVVTFDLQMNFVGGVITEKPGRPT